MRLHFLQHGPTEGPSMILDWALQRGAQVSGTQLHLGESLPSAEEFDFLVIMGGPMNVYEYRNHPWLRSEKRLIADAIKKGKRILGVCLGAQLIADVLGAKVYQNTEFEIGWFPVRFLPTRNQVRCFETFPEELSVLHWHGDTFDLPAGATPIAESEACKNQAFAIGDRIVGLQFHIEVREEDVQEFIGEVLPSPALHVQSKEAILALKSKSQPIKEVLYTLLDRLAEGLA